MVVTTNFTTTVDNYAGPTLTNLTRVGGHVGFGPTNKFHFNAIPSTAYIMAIDGNDGHKLHPSLLSRAGMLTRIFAR